MPIYTYVCNDCGEKFDLLTGMTPGKEEPECEKCNSKNIKKLFSPFGIGKSNNETSSSESSCPTGTCPTCF
ncbi:MAG: FmdB family zinc ribbon protein [Candidatus Humimicrobiaceae bacterium]